MNRRLLVIILILIVFGLVVLSPAGIVDGQKKFGSPYYYLTHQLLYGVIPGLVGMFILSLIDYRFWKKISLFVLVGSLALMIMIFMPGFGHGLKGATRWISLGVFSFGFLLVVYYASNAMMSLIITFDRSIMEHKRFFLHQRWKAIQLTTIIILLLIASTLILLGQEQLTYLIRKLLGLKKSNLVWLNGIRWMVIIGLFFYGIAFIYKYAPSVKIRWKLVSPGSLLATALILSTTLLFSYWVNNFGNYNKVYGSIGTIMILMILAYINSLILLIGFELNVSITYLTQHAAQRKKLQESTS